MAVNLHTCFWKFRVRISVGNISCHLRHGLFLLNPFQCSVRPVVDKVRSDEIVVNINQPKKKNKISSTEILKQETNRDGIRAAKRGTSCVTEMSVQKMQSHEYPKVTARHVAHFSVFSTKQGRGPRAVFQMTIVRVSNDVMLLTDRNIS
jgi:hypothetical protein